MKNKNKQTKFPVARIKKIMQKDEEVGKVAQATPIVISKALELFLGLIIDEANKVTSERGSKKVEAYHLKHAVETTEMLDFLKEIVEAVPDPSAGGTIDLESENAEAAKKKRGKGKKAANANGEPPKKRKKKKEEAGAEGTAVALGAGMGEGDASMKSEHEHEHEHMHEDEEDGRRSRHVASNYRPRSPSSDDEFVGQPFMRH
ncbi:histone-fold-containing protein [Lyophyllum atratum]|nr:histone-fold-containing protein [Lyophyllum atratum]